MTLSELVAFAMHSSHVKMADKGGEAIQWKQQLVISFECVCVCVYLNF